MLVKIVDLVVVGISIAFQSSFGLSSNFKDRLISTVYKFRLHLCFGLSFLTTYIVIICNNIDILFTQQAYFVLNPSLCTRDLPTPYTLSGGCTNPKKCKITSYSTLRYPFIRILAQFRTSSYYSIMQFHQQHNIRSRSTKLPSLL